MQELSPQQLKTWQDEGRQFTLVDVREEYEHEAFSIGGLLLPLGELMSSAAALPKDQPVVLYCEKGIRSVIAAQRLAGIGFQQLYNLTGGMKAWRIGTA